MKIRHSAPHFEPHSFLAFELCAYVSISKYVKQEDEKTLPRNKANKNSTVSDFIFGAEIILLLLGYPSISSNLYLLLTEFEGRTLSYRPRFFPFNLWRETRALN